MTLTANTTTRRRDEGSVLVLTLLLTLLILAIGLLAMWVASSTTRVPRARLRRQEAMTAIDVGVRRAHRILLRTVGRGDLPGFSAALQGRNCNPAPEHNAARQAAFVPQKGRVLCDGDSVPAPSPTAFLENVPAIDPFRGGYGGVKVDVGQLDRVQYTVYLRNDDDEYRYCNGVREHGEPSDNGACQGLHPSMHSAAEQRTLRDEDGRAILRVEARGRDGLTFAAVEMVINGAHRLTPANAYTQANIDAQN